MLAAWKFFSAKENVKLRFLIYIIDSKCSKYSGGGLYAKKKKKIMAKINLVRAYVS